MKNAKTFFKAQTFILLMLFLSLIVCFIMGDVAFADTQMSVVNFESYEGELVVSDLDGTAGVITDLECIRRNKDIFEDYINIKNGKVLVPDRDNDNNVLAYLVTDIAENGIETQPIHTYTNIDKTKIDYEELILSNSVSAINEDNIVLHSSSDEDAYDFMSVQSYFEVYVKNGWQKLIHIASVRMKFAVDYFPTDNNNYNFYVGRYEISVMPTSKTTLKRFSMIPMQHDSSYMDEISSQSNNAMATISKGFTFNTGINAKEGISIGTSDVEISVGLGQSISIGFSYSISSADGAAGFSPAARYRMNDDCFGDPFIIRRSGRSNSVSQSDLRNDKGKAYTALYYATYRAPKSYQYLNLGLVFKDLELWGQVGEPSYDLSNINWYGFFASWDYPFNNKTIIAMGSDPEGSQRFQNHEVHCTMPPKGTIGTTIFSYGEN